MQKFKLVWISILGFVSVFAIGSRAALPPTAENCKAWGGQVKVLSGDLVEDEFCLLDRAQISTWTLYAFTERGQVSQAVAAFVGHPAPMDVSLTPNEYCNQLEGMLIIMTDAEGQQVTVCRFEDDSEIEVETLFNGPKDKGNLALAKILGVK